MSAKNLSRRDFLKGMTAGAVAAAGFGVMSVCNAPAAHADGIYTPGTYSATAEGMGTVTVTATFDADSITAIDLDVSNETANIGQLAKDELIAQCMAAQSAEIDGVSGASLTSAAVRVALNNCIAQAKGEAVASSVVVENTEAAGEVFVAADLIQADIDASAVVTGEISSYAEEIDCDIVVAGAGASGVIAAVYAAEQGKKVCLLQKEAIAVSQGNCGSALIKSGSTERGLKRWKSMCMAFNSWRSNPELIDAYIDNSEDALMFYIDRAGFTPNYADGAQTNETTGVQIYQWTGSGVYTGVWTDGTQSYDLGEESVEVLAPWFGPKPQNFGTMVTGVLNDAAAKYENLDIHYSTPIVQLIQNENGDVTGCVGKDVNGNFIKFNAKAVILATGAYENNKSMVRRFCPDTEAFDKKVYHRTGDGNILAILAGGVMEPVAHSKVMHDFDAGLMWDEPFLFVNMAGQRFMNEECEMAYISNQLKYQPGYMGENRDADHQDTESKGWYCQIYDSDYMSYANAGVPDFVMERYLKDEDVEHPSVFPELIDTFRADTLEELCAKLDLPVEETMATIARYNELCDAGYDDDFGKKAEHMNKIQTAPFWGIRRHIRCSSITAGVQTNGNSQVIREDGTAIKGLYAAGNLGGAFFGAPDYPFFQGGLSLGHATTFGYIAAKHAVENC